MSIQALKESLPVVELGGMGGIPVTVTAGSLPQQQPRGPYNMQVFNLGNTQVLMAGAVQLPYCIKLTQRQ